MSRHGLSLGWCLPRILVTKKNHCAQGGNSQVEIYPKPLSCEMSDYGGHMEATRLIRASAMDARCRRWRDFGHEIYCRGMESGCVLLCTKHFHVGTYDETIFVVPQSRSSHSFPQIGERETGRIPTTQGSEHDFYHTEFCRNSLTDKSLSVWDLVVLAL